LLYLLFCLTTKWPNLNWADSLKSAWLTESIPR